MNERRLFTRRKFIIGSAATLGGVILAWTQRLLGIPEARAQEPKLTPRVYLPIVFGSGEPLPKPRVVHVRDADATNWNGTDPFYNAVDQDVVNNMVQTGLQLLTGQDSWPDIWNALFERVHPSGYSAGQKIAIKVNLNASKYDCYNHDNLIDALPQPVLALISGMVAAGVQPGDVIVYDSIRVVPSYLSGPIWAVYPEVKFVGTGSCPGVIAPSHGKDPSLTVRFNDPYGYVNDRQLADVLYDATYVINMPIIKRHGGDDANPVTLAFKNHFGSLNRISGSGNDDLHLYINTSTSLYRTTYSPFVDIYSNTNIRAKTVLTLGDGLYGGTAPSSPPIQSWSIFGGACNSLFFGTDPVAVDCVMADLIVAEGLVSKAHTYDYLFCAEEAGLGVCEGTRDDPGGNPLQAPYGSGYDDIEYVRVDT
ncbi:MAG: DUF362 domain-containing protein [Anaerolineae bacterium]|nr:DUF362 domain-containing protein [Anaerolineae bacterium]